MKGATRGVKPLERDLNHFRQLLDQERSRQESLVRGLEDDGLSESMSEVSGELSGIDQHTADAGAEMYEREKDLGLRAAARETINLIHDAMNRVSDGSYGTCERCGQ